jgi:hypothetical protein
VCLCDAGDRRIRRVGTVENDDRVDWREAFQLFRGDVVYVWHAGLHAGEVADSLLSPGIRKTLLPTVWSHLKMEPPDETEPATC